MATQEDAAGGDPACVQVIPADGYYFGTFTCVSDLAAKTTASYVFNVTAER